MDIFEKLQEAGLTGNEAKVYLQLLKIGELSANQIAREIGMDRTLVYTVLNHLIEKGQVGYIIKKNKKIFSCSNPENLLNPLRSKEILVSDLIKELKNIKHEEKTEIDLRIYEGREGIKNFINLTLKEKEFCAFGSTGLAFFELYEMPAIVKKAAKLRIKIRIIGNKEYKNQLPFKLKRIKYGFLDIKSEATTSIFGDYVSIHVIKPKPFFIIIKNKKIARSYKAYFEFLWKRAKRKI